MSKTEKKKINRVINFLKKGLISLSEELEETAKGINDFITSLSKAQKDLKEVPDEGEFQTVSTSSKKVVATPGAAKTVAASTLFTLLSGTSGAAPAAPAAASAPAAVSAAPKPPGGGGPPSVKAGPPIAPGAGPPSRGGNLPPAPKLPPTGSGGPPKAPAMAQRAPSPPGGGAPPKAPGGTPATAQAGGGLSSLRDEMLEELTRLKKIMRGE